MEIHSGLRTLEAPRGNRYVPAQPRASEYPDVKNYK